MSSPSKVSLCNIALIAIKANTVVDIDTPTTNEENVCHILFDQIAREVISQGSWTSCLTRASLVEVATVPVFGYSRQYQLPTTPAVLKVLNINDCPQELVRYDIEGDKLLTNEGTAQIRYVFYNTDVGSWDPNLCTTFIARMKAELVMPLQGDLSRYKLELQNYKDILDDELAINGEQSSKQVYQTTTLTDHRQ